MTEPPRIPGRCDSPIVDSVSTAARVDHKATDMTFIVPCCVSAIAEAANQKWPSAHWGFTVEHPADEVSTIAGTTKLLSMILMSGTGGHQSSSRFGKA